MIGRGIGSTRRVFADRLARRGQGGFALMAGLAIWVGVSGVTMLALLNMTMTSSRIAANQAESAVQFRAVDAAMETAVTQISRDPDALIGATTGRGDGSCVEPLGRPGSEGLQYRDDHGVLVVVTARCVEPTDAPRAAMAAARVAAAGPPTRQAVRSVELEAVMTLSDGNKRAAGTARIRVSDVRGNGSRVVIDDWSITPERPYVPTSTTTTTTPTTTTAPTTTAVPTTTVKPTTTTVTPTTVKPTTTTAPTTTVKPTTTTAPTTTVKPTTTTVKPTTTTAPSAPSPATWTMRVTSDWADGYCAEVTVTNPTSATLTWIVDTPIQGQVSSFWNGEYTRSGNTLRVRGADWNRTINAGGSTGFGFCSLR